MSWTKPKLLLLFEFILSKRILLIYIESNLTMSKKNPKKQKTKKKTRKPQFILSTGFVLRPHGVASIGRQVSNQNPSSSR